MTRHPADPVASTPLYAAMVAGHVDYRPWEPLPLDDTSCFLCGVVLDGSSRTLEDVFPEWMQRTLNRGSQHPEILLPNLTSIRPGQVKIPACLSCNGRHLSRVEQAVSEAFALGPTAVAALPERTLRVWLGKIAYGIRRNDLRLRADIRDPGSTIATTDDVEALRGLHLLLQEARDVVHVPDGYSTIFVFRSQTVGCNVCDFDAAMPIGWPYPVMIRFKDTTVMGAVDDRGALGGLSSSPTFGAAGRLELHPIQARALWALLVCDAMLLRADRVPVRYGVSERRLWIDRLPQQEPALESGEHIGADALLAGLINEAEEALIAQGGAQGLLLDSAGEPRVMPFVHGTLRLPE